MKTKRTTMWNVLVGVGLALGLCAAVPQVASGVYSGVGTFTKITAQGDLTDGYYVFTPSNTTGSAQAMVNTNIGAYFSNIVVTISSSQITDPHPCAVWKIETSGDYKTIFNEVSNRYVTYAGTANAAYAGATVGTTGLWSFTYSSTFGWFVSNSAITTRSLQYNVTSPRFACYSVASQKRLDLYKLAEEASAGSLAIDNTGNPSASTVYRSDTGKLVFGFQLTATDGPVSFTAVTLTRTLGGSAASGDFYNYKLYYDSNGDGSVSGETQLSTTQADGSTIAFASISGQSVAVGTPRKYLVTADILSTAVKGGTMNLKINANGDVTSDATSITSTAPYPSSAVDHTVGNKTPTATAQIVAADEDVDETITLAGTDTDGDTLSYIISTLPAAGKLYQTADGTTKGDEITSVPTTVSDSSHRVIYVSAANGNGSGYGNFGFKVNDGTIDSSEATVTVNVAAVSDAPVISVNPSISGDAVVDETLTTTSGTWDRPANPSGTITYSYQWYRDDDQSAGGETTIGSDQNTYDVVAGDVGKYIKVVVTATENSEASTPAASSYVGPVVAGGAPEQWTVLIPDNQGTPVYTYYLGDNLLYQFQFAINTDTTGWTVEYGLGKSTGGSGWTWNGGTYVSNNNSDVYWTSDQNEFQFTDTGDFYYAGRFTTDDVPPYTYYAMDDWTSANLTLAAVNYFTVEAIANPSDPTAAPNASAPATAIDLDWTANAQSHDVMVVRKLTSESWTEPTQGTGYSAPGTLGDGDIVYIGSDGEFTDTGLDAETTYNYKFYSVNNDYYSEGVTAQGTTDPCEPDAPTGLYASDTNDTSFTASWTAPAAGNPPTNYYIDVSLYEEFGTAAAPKSTLAPGDIAIIGANFDGNDDYSFVALVDIADGTVIRFTENGWTNDTFRPGEGTYIWSNSTAGAIAAGTIITMSNNYASTGTWLSGGGTWALSSSGDQIIAYQLDGSTITPIFAVNSDGTGWQDYATSANNSGLPSGLTDGTTAMAIDEVDNFVYDMSTVSGTQAQLLAAIGNKANWSSDDATPYTLPPAGTFSVTGGTTPSYVTGYENLSVGNVTSFEVTGLDPETTYYFRVRGEGEESCVGADSTTANVTTLAEEVPDYYTLLNDRGAPWQTYTLGDTLAEQFQFAINTDTTGWDVEWGYGASTDGSGWTWTDASYVSNNNADAYWTSPADTLQLTAVGDLYYAGRFTSLEPRTYYAAIDWTNTPDNLTLAAASYITVEAIDDPTDQTATQSVTDPTGSIDLDWALNASDNDVLIVRKLSTASWTEPTQGTPYAVDDPLGAGTVIYVGGDTEFTDSGLTDGTTYDYKFYSVNNDFYSPGVTAQASTLACEPEAPTDLNATDTDSTSFTANWTASAGNPATNYFIDVSLEADFGGVGGTLLDTGFEDWGTGWSSPEAADWSQNSATFNGNLPQNAHTGTNSIGMNAIGDWIQTPLLTDPGTLSFWTRTSSDPGDWTVTVSTSPNGSDWTVQDTIVESGAGGDISDTYTQITVPLNLTGDYYVRWDMTARTADSCYIDDVQITGTGEPSYVAGYENLLLGNVTSADITGLCPNRTYYFRVRAQGEGGCVGADSSTADVTTDKGVLTVTGLTGVDKTYDGTTDATASGTAALDGILCEDDVTLAGTPVFTFVQAGAGTDIDITTSGYTLDGADAANYDLTQPTLSADIDPKGLTVDGAMAQDKVYDGNTDATVDFDGANVIEVVEGDDVSLDSSGYAAAFAQANVGTWDVTVSGLDLAGADAANYELTQPTLEAEITAKGLTVDGAIAQDKEYDGTTDATVDFTGASLVGVVGTEDVSLDYSAYAAAFASAEVGTWDVTVSGLTLDGDDAGNYSLTQPTLSAEITPAGLIELTVSGAVAQDKIYDGNTDATVDFTSATLVGVEGGDDVELDYSAYSAAFADEDVGTWDVTVSGLFLTGADASKYSLTQPVLEAEITAKGLTVDGAMANNKVYDGNTDATVDFEGASVIEVVEGDDVSLDSSAYSAAFADEDVGTWDVTVSGLTLDGADAGNYSLTQPTLEANITAKELTVDGAMAVDKDYDGTTDATITGASLVGVVDGDDVSLDSLAGTFAQSDADMDIAVTAALTLMGPDVGNYTLTQPTGLSADINPLAVIIYPNADQSKVYGSEDPKSFLFTQSTPLVGEDELTGDLGRAPGEPVGFYDYTIGTLDAGANYELSLGGTAQFEITAKELTVDGAVADDKDYDTTTAATISGATLVGVVGTDDVELDALVGSFAQADAGTDIAVTAALTLKGVDAGNYTLTQPTGLMANIDKAPQTIVFDDPMWDFLDIPEGRQVQTYGDGPFDLPDTADSGLTVSYTSSDESVATVNSPLTIVGVGTTIITASQAGNDNYLPAEDVEWPLDVDPLAVTILPTPGQFKYEGDPDPVFTFTPSPPLVGDDEFTGALAREPDEALGFYAYLIGTLDAGENYELSLSLLSDEFEIREPTSVVLYYFVAGAENGQTVLRWRTASELDTVGFWVERLDGEAWVRVNGDIIYGKDPMGAVYDLVDAGAEVGGTYTWRIVEIETDGSQQIYGPFTRTVSALGFAAEDAITVTPDGVLIRWLSREDESYKILRSTDLTQGFEAIAEDIPATVPQNEYLDEEVGNIGMYMIQVDED